MYFDSMLSFQDDDNINRLILKYLEKLFLRKIFKIKNFEKKIMSSSGGIGSDEGSDGGTILKVGGPKVYPVFFYLQRITRSYKLTAIFVVLALATANAACR